MKGKKKEREREIEREREREREREWIKIMDTINRKQEESFQGRNSKQEVNNK